MNNLLIKVAGVTFENRQHVLAGLLQQNRQVITVDLVYTTFNGEFAIQLVENSSRQVIGWIPRSELYRFTACNIRQMTGFIGWYNGVYYCKLDKQVAPSAQQWAAAVTYCKSYGFGIPAFDARALGFLVNYYCKEV